MKILTAVTRNLAIARFLSEYSGPFRGTFSKIRLDIYACKNCPSSTGLRANGLPSLYADCVPMSNRGVFFFCWRWIRQRRFNLWPAQFCQGYRSLAVGHRLRGFSRPGETVCGRFVALLCSVALPDNLLVVLASLSIDTTFCSWLLRAHLRFILHPKPGEGGLNS